MTRAARRVEFELSAGRIAALEADPGGSRPAALFVPGYTGSKEDFMPLLRPLAADGLRAVALDQRGQYESEWASSAAAYSLPALAADICELAVQIRKTATTLHLVGHSFGGLVGRAAVLARPELFDTLTLMGSGPAAIAGQRRGALDAGEPVLAELGMSGLWEAMQTRAQADPRYVHSPAVQAFLRARFMATDPVGLQVMGQTLREVPDCTEALAALGKPLLVLHGVDEDAWPPPVQADMARRLGAEHVVIDAAAHSPALENPRQTRQALLDFWRRQV